jgi:hypothetical protein
VTDSPAKSVHVKKKSEISKTESELHKVIQDVDNSSFEFFAVESCEEKEVSEKKKPNNARKKRGS